MGALGQGSAMEEMAKGVAMGYMGQVDANLSAYTGSTMALLRYYFAVNNTYVLAKLRLLALPYVCSNWERKQGDGGHLLPPKDDFNAPDLYLPLMGYVTYILAYGYALGAEGRFTPDVLGLAGSSGLAIVLLEVAGLKLSFYLLQGSRVTVLELVSCSGYKFVGVVFTLLVKQLFGPTIGYGFLAFACASVGFFMVCTLRQAQMQSQGSFTPGFMTEGVGSPSLKAHQNYVLWATAGLQLLWSWYLCRV